MKTRALLLVAAAAGLMLPALARADDYAGMLGYLNQSRIDGRALTGASGAIAVNQVAGDLNAQANLVGMAQGNQARVDIDARSTSSRNSVLLDGPLHASAHIDGQALQGANGIATINQTSGIANTSMNVVRTTLAQEGIRESDDEALAESSVTASAGGQGRAGNGLAAGTRSVGVAASAMQGFDGVLQLNQIAGAGNDTANILGMSVHGNP